MSMQNFRRKGETGEPLEGFQLTKENAKEVAAWCDGTIVEEMDAMDSTKTYVGINLLAWDGVGRLSEGDYLIKDRIGDFVIRWAPNFEQQFEKVE